MVGKSGPTSFDPGSGLEFKGPFNIWVVLGLSDRKSESQSR